MDELDRIAERIRSDFDARSAARDKALAHTRLLTRYCANTIRAVHRQEREAASEQLRQAAELAETLRTDLEAYPELYYAGYTQDALKEFAEASIVYGLVGDNSLPAPEELHLQNAAYLQGLAEAVGELRRRALDVLRHGHSQEAEQILEQMDDIYTILVTMDYPDAITGGLRRLTDLVRGITERTRGDVLISLRQQQLEANMLRLEERLAETKLE
jgi:translin